MYFIAGSGMLFVAFLLVTIGYRLLNRPGARHNPEAFGASEVLSLVFTGLVAFGAASYMHGAVTGEFPANLIELAAALAALVVACVAVRLALNLVFPRHPAEKSAGAMPPPVNPRGRPGHETGPVKPAGSKARRAA